jgi:hypothetical protein
MLVLIVAASWCALSVPVALLLGRLLGAPTAELLGVEGVEVLYRFPDGCVARVALAAAAVPVNR